MVVPALRVVLPTIRGQRRFTAGFAGTVGDHHRQVVPSDLCHIRAPQYALDGTARLKRGRQPAVPKVLISGVDIAATSLTSDPDWRGNSRGVSLSSDSGACAGRTWSRGYPDLYTPTGMMVITQDRVVIAGSLPPSPE